ncbi:MAG: outer membrane protein assembly factor BamD [Paludibacteraceae bacterium]|nr:outer membrane protein assembly factor BamD [Paludibacteraceae bacterium]
MKAKYLLILLCSMVLFTSCGEYQRLVKSTDNDLKFAKAKEYYEKGKYLEACTLLEAVVVPFRGTQKGEEALFLLGSAHYKNKDYIAARSYFSGYMRSSPRGNFAEESQSHVGLCYYQDSPEAKLDQVGTKKAIEEFDKFMKGFPNSMHVAEAQSKRQELNDKLAYKAYLNSRLYYRLGNYQGNNYRSCVISATNALREFPESIYREELSFLILKAKYRQAVESVESKKQDRYHDTIDEYYNFIQEYPDTEYKKEALSILEDSQKHVGSEKR